MYNFVHSYIPLFVHSYSIINKNGFFTKITDKTFIIKSKTSFLKENL